MGADLASLQPKLRRADNEIMSARSHEANEPTSSLRPGAFSELHVTERADQRGRPEWELTQPLAHTTSDGTTYTAPTGMRTNFASVPFFLTWLVSRTGRHNKAAVIHDLLWRRANDGTEDRYVADTVFREALAHLGVSWLRRWMMWAGVRQGGLLRRHRGRWPIRDIVTVTAMTIVIAPIVIPVSSVVVAARVALWAVDFVPTWLGKQRPPVVDEL